MKIVICASITSTLQVKELSDILLKQGHEIEIPLYCKKILNGELSFADFLAEKEKNGDASFRERAGEDLIKRYYHLIKSADAILVVNTEKNGIQNYIGGNVLLEMGFAYVLDKKIFLMNEIPAMTYADEIKAMKPLILNGDLSKIN